MKRFEEWTYEDAVRAIEAHIEERVGKEAYKRNRAMVEQGDFWQNGDLWIGPRGSDEAWIAKIRATIERQHVPGGAVLEAVGNFVRGLLGKQANIQAVPLEDVEPGSEEEAQLKAEADQLVAQLSVWWDRVRLWSRLRRVAARSRWAGWGPIRLRIPPGRLVEDTTDDGSTVLRLPRFETFEEALGAIDLSTPEPDACVVLEHPDTQQRAAIFHYELDEDGKKVQRAELWYQDGESTVLRLLTKGSDEVETEAYPWGGRLPISELDGEIMITEPVRRAESAYMAAQTNIMRAIESSGFRERYTMNAEPAGIWLPTPPEGIGPTPTVTDDRGNTLYLHPLPRALGAGITTDLVGIVTERTADGEKRATPGIAFADPVDPEPLIRAAEYWRGRVLQLCYQGHLAMTGRGEASGYAYEQARAAYVGDLDAHVDPTERAITEILEAAVVMGESMMENPPRYLERFRLIVTVVPDPGPVSSAAQQEIRANVEAGLLSRSSAMAQIGVDDVAAELEAIERDPQSQLGVLKERTAIMAQLKAAEPEMSLVQAAVIAGWDEEEARRLFAEADAAAVQARQAREAIAAALQAGATATGDGA